MPAMLFKASSLRWYAELMAKTIGKTMATDTMDNARNVKHEAKQDVDGQIFTYAVFQKDSNKGKKDRDNDKNCFIHNSLRMFIVSFEPQTIPGI